MQPIKDVIEVGRFLIPYRIYKNNGPQVICVNGVQQSMAMWHSFINRFSKNYEIVLFDFPNQGKAKINYGASQISLIEQEEILLSVMDRTKLKTSVTVCTASWGGVIAASLASKYPDRIKRLILASLGTKPNKKMAETINKGALFNINDREKMAQTLIKAFGENLPLRIKQGIISQFKNMKETNVRAFL